MIHSFTCENFYSIGDKAEVDLTVGENAPVKDTYARVTTGDRVSVVESIIGPNASGKTNVLKALSFMKWLIVDAYVDDPDSSLPIRAFGSNDNSKSTFVSVAFSVKDRAFNYEFELVKERILLEKLVEKSKTTERVTSKILFTRRWNETSGDYSVRDKALGVAQDKLRKNTSAVATAFRDKNPLATLIAQYWRDGVFTNVMESGYRSYHHHHSMLDRVASHAIEFFYGNPELKKQVESILLKYDIGFGAFQRHEVQEKTFFGIRHRFDGAEFELPLEYESSGTKQAIIILRFILSALASGGIAIIDELDANLHPEIVEELITMFTSKELNPRSAQIIFSSHTPTILSMLDKYQIILVEKNDLGQSEVWRLDSIKGVRLDDNYYAKYIAGAYGAVPNIG